jgi:hypothetical protein
LISHSGEAPVIHGLTIGTLDAIDIAARAIRVAGITYQLDAPGLLLGLEVGQFVTVVWDQAGDCARMAHIVASATRPSPEPAERATRGLGTPATLARGTHPPWDL